MPSYTYVGTANALVLRGAKIVFIDIRPDTLNIDERLIESAITKKTKAIVAVHYAGVACEMDAIMKISAHYKLYVIEDAAHSVMSLYKKQCLGTIGHFGAFSFHDTKNYTSAGVGGALVINEPDFFSRAETLYSNGTNKNQFLNGMVERYTWVGIGGNYQPSELQAAYLFAQLEMANKINKKRREIWAKYFEAFAPLATNKLVELPDIPSACIHNAHIFYLKLKNNNQRISFINFLNKQGIESVFHYIPLHSSVTGEKFGEFIGEDKQTTKNSERIVRLPIYYALTDNQLNLVIKNVIRFYRET